MSQESKQESRQHVVDSKKESIQQTACSRQGKTKGFLSTAYYLLPTERSSLPTVYCLLSTKKGLLFTEKGFTLVELMITMVIFLIVIAAASGILTGMVTQFKQQSKIAETNIEGIIGLEILRRDIEHAGYGLPWNVVDPDGTTTVAWSALQNYQEAASVGCAPNPAGFNDAPNNAPRAIISKDKASFSDCGANSVFNDSDYLVIKSVNIAGNSTCEKSTTLRVGDVKRTWTPDRENVNKLADGTTDNNVGVIVVSPGTETIPRPLIATLSGSDRVYRTSYNATSGYAPPQGETRIIYGANENTDLRMPFNRADYWIHRQTTSSATDEVPDRCAPNTGVLRKAVVNHGNGIRGDVFPLLDCVADMQVVYRLNTGVYTADISTLKAQEIREQVREVRVYILAHEGQRDVNYTHSIQVINLAEDVGVSLGRAFDLATEIGTGWQNYRWKVYTMVVKPNNLR